MLLIQVRRSLLDNIPMIGCFDTPMLTKLHLILLEKYNNNINAIMIDMLSFPPDRYCALNLVVGRNESAFVTDRFDLLDAQRPAEYDLFNDSGHIVKTCLTIEQYSYLVGLLDGLREGYG